MNDFKHKDQEGLWLKFRRYSPGNPEQPGVLLLPATHVGDGLFHQEAKHEAWASDVVLKEGLALPGAGLLRPLYRWIAIWLRSSWQGKPARSGENGNRRDEAASGWCKLIHRGEDGWKYEIDLRDRGYPDSYRVVHFKPADLPRKKSIALAKELPWATWIVVPAFLIISAFLTPFSLKRQDLVEIDPEDHEFGDGFVDRHVKAFFSFALNARDRHLIEVLSKEIEGPENKGKTICIEFGVGHMPALHDYLMSAGYALTDERRVLVVARDADVADNQGHDCYGPGRERLQRRFGRYVAPESSDELPIGEGAEPVS